MDSGLTGDTHPLRAWCFIGGVVVRGEAGSAGWRDGPALQLRSHWQRAPSWLQAVLS
jgi:hypothetical protein